jgi:hypothetical protein
MAKTTGIKAFMMEFAVVKIDGTSKKNPWKKFVVCEDAKLEFVTL